LLMAMERLELIVKALVAHGRDPGTPAAVIERATLDGQRILRAPLGRLADEVVSQGAGAPAVVVVGEVVDALAEPGDTS
jgi:uroporphyrin-III C-methyltransferase / precorrin-2 dehydrogenase / sirohydrochlorin ferrochelatase